MKKILFSAAAMAAIMSSCSQNEVIENVTEANAISFAPYSSIATKGVISDNTTLEAGGFRVFGYFHDGQTGVAAPNWTNDSETSDFMFNQLVEYTTAWTYNPVKFWSNDANDRYSFFAYHPIEDADGIIDVVSTNTSTGVPQIEYTIPTADLTTSLDFVAGQNMVLAKQAGAVTLNMKHQLTRMNVEAKVVVTNGTTGGAASYNKTDLIIKKLDIIDGTTTLPTTSTYSFDTETTTATGSNPEDDHNQDGTWTHSAWGDIDFSGLLGDKNDKYPTGTTAAAGDYPADKGVVVNAEDAAWTSILGTDEYLFLIPPAGATGLETASDMKFVVEYDILTEDPAVANGYTYSSNKAEFTLAGTVGNGLLKQGIAYNFQLTFNLTEVILTANVVGWDEATSGQTVVEIAGVITEF